jgi:hypothetical protein
MTPLQEDPSARAPWTRRMFGRPHSLSPTPCVELWKGEFRQLSGAAHRTILRFESASCELGISSISGA